MRNIQKKRKLFTWGYLIVLFIIGIVMFLADMQIINIGQRSSLGEDIIFLFRPQNLDNFQEMFNVIWGTAITIIIFILEISHQYKYGVSIKSIVYLSLGDKLIFMGATGYLFLCPWFYLCIKWKWVWSAVWCIVIAVVSFAMALFFCMRTFQSKSVAVLLKDITIKKILSFEGSVDSDEKTNHGFIDGLPSTNLIMHIDYTSAEETKYLVDVLIDIMEEAFGEEQQYFSILNKKPVHRESAFEEELAMVMIMNWTNHIIFYSGYDSEEKCSRTIRILFELAYRLQRNHLKKNMKDVKTLIAVQISIPLLDISNKYGKTMIARLWRAIEADCRNYLIYLLLYTEYCFWFVDSEMYLWFLTDEQNMRRQIQMQFQREIVWDDTFAWKLWQAWRMYNIYDAQLGLEYFFVFDDDIKKLKNGRKHEVKSKVFTLLVEAQIL